MRDLVLAAFIVGMLPSYYSWGVAAPIILLLLQPDFGTAVVIVVVSFSLLFVRGLATKYVVGTVGLVAAGIASAIAFSPYRMKRFLTFLDPNCKDY